MATRHRCVIPPPVGWPFTCPDLPHSVASWNSRISREADGDVVEKTRLLERASRQLIRSDLKYSMALMRTYVSRVEHDESIVWLLLSSIQHLSLVAYETNRFLTGLDASGAESPSWAHHLTIAASRHSTKLFNDTKKSHADLLTAFVEAAATDRTWYAENNKAPWLFRTGSPLGWLINDTSVVHHDGRLLCTSHSINFHAKLNPAVAPQDAFDRARELAAYLAALADTEQRASARNPIFGAAESTARLGAAWRPSALSIKDARYQRLYRAMFPAAPVPTGIALAVIRTDLTGLQLLRELALADIEIGPATFKLRYVGLWQILETLRAISSPDSPVELTSAMRADLGTLLSEPTIAALQTPASRRLRNVLTHYGLGQTEPELLDWDDSLLGLPELHLDGIGWVDLDQRLDQQILRVVGLIDSWAGSITHTLEEPHE